MKLERIPSKNRELTQARTHLLKLLSVIFIAVLAGSNPTSAGGEIPSPAIAQHHKEESLLRLKAYASEKEAREKTTNNTPDSAGQCEEWLSQKPACLEKKYIDGESFIVHLGFIRDAKIPKQPSSQYVKVENAKGRWDDTDKKNFIADWSDRVIAEYIGENKDEFREILVTSIGSKFISMRIKTSNPNNLRAVINDPRIVSMTHIGNPDRPLEEVAN